MGYANQVLGRACTWGASLDSLPMQEVWTYAQRRFRVLLRKKPPLKSHRARARCCCAYCRAASEHEIGTGIWRQKRRDLHGPIRLNIHTRETKSVIEAPTVTNKRTRGSCGFPRGGQPSKGVGRPKVPHIGRFFENLEELECNWPLEQAEAWADVKANVVVKEVDALVSCDSWELWSATLVLSAPPNSMGAAANSLVRL